jgi:hypothetical protein
MAAVMSPIATRLRRLQGQNGGRPVRELRTGVMRRGSLFRSHPDNSRDLFECLIADSDVQLVEPQRIQ